MVPLPPARRRPSLNLGARLFPAGNSRLPAAFLLLLGLFLSLLLGGGFPRGAFAAEAARKGDSPSLPETVPDTGAVDFVAMGRNLRLEAEIRTEFVKLTRGQDVPVLKASALKDRIADTTLILVDAREAKEREVSMLPRALAPEEFAARYRRGFPKGATVLVYCTIGYRSGLYAQELRKQGIAALNLEGGVLLWSHEGGEFRYRDAEGRLRRTRRVHVYAPEWNLLREGYKAVW